MTTDSLQLEKSNVISGLGTFSKVVTAAGRYTLEVRSTIPYQTPGSAEALANPSTREISDVTLVADVAGSLNSKFFTFYGPGNLNGYYVWYNINSAGVDPAPVGLTGYAVAGATGATAATLATATRAAITATDVTVGGATTHVVITSKYPGITTAAVDGSAGTGFTFATTVDGSYGSGSGLNIVASNGGSAVMTLNYPSPNQPSMGGSVEMQVAAAATVSVAFTSLAPADNLPNGVKSVVNFYQTVKQ